jgi:hypothetical protein
MDMIRQPLRMSEKENRAAVARSEKRRTEVGCHAGNRHDRRLAEKRDRQAKRRALQTAGD